jgi:hypothetical protein
VGSSEDKGTVGDVPCSSGIDKGAQGIGAKKRRIQPETLGVSGRAKGVGDISVTGARFWLLLLSQMIVAVFPLSYPRAENPRGVR